MLFLLSSVIFASVFCNTVWHPHTRETSRRRNVQSPPCPVDAGHDDQDKSVLFSRKIKRLHDLARRGEIPQHLAEDREYDFGDGRPRAVSRALAAVGTRGIVRRHYHELVGMILPNTKLSDLAAGGLKRWKNRGLRLSLSAGWGSASDPARREPSAKKPWKPAVRQI